MKTPRYLFLTLALALTAQVTYAGSATWDLNPTTNDWNTAANWTPATVPNDASAIATFGVSNTTNITLSANVLVAGLVFNPAASAYTIAAGSGSTGTTLTIGDAGIVNNSGQTQTFLSPVTPSSSFLFTGTAKAGTRTLFDNPAPSSYFFFAERFIGNSSADSATFINEGPTQAPYSGGIVEFEDTSTGGSATIICNAGLFGSGEVSFAANSTGGYATIVANGGTAPHTNGGVVALNGTATLGHATVTLNGSDGGQSGGALLDCIYEATAGDATLIAHGGSVDPGHIQFQPDGNGGQARVELFGNGELDLIYPDTNYPPVTIGSLEGDGFGFLSSAHLVIGGNSISTIFSGVLADGGRLGGTGATLMKVGSETLAFTGANTYTGGTTVSGGTLLANNSSGSATGPGLVAVNAGTLGGLGTVSGDVTVGTGSGAGAFLAPSAGARVPATFTTAGALVLNSDATYTYTGKAKGKQVRTDQVVAHGVTINGATFSSKLKVRGTLAAGTVLTVISNTATTPISGTFGNLPDGAIITANGNNLQANYEGGDGNDLTLTVVP